MNATVFVCVCGFTPTVAPLVLHSCKHSASFIRCLTFLSLSAPIFLNHIYIHDRIFWIYIYIYACVCCWVQNSHEPTSTTCCFELSSFNSRNILVDWASTKLFRLIACYLMLWFASGFIMLKILLNLSYLFLLIIAQTSLWHWAMYSIGHRMWILHPVLAM